MRNTILFIPLVCASLTYAQQRTVKNTTPTSYGSFGTIKLENEIETGSKLNKMSLPAKQYKHSTVKTFGGGTATFVKFNTKSSNPIAKKDSPKINEDNGTISVYPNPTNGEMTVKYFIPKNETAEFAIYDLAGKKLTSYFLTGESSQLTISERNLTSGIYLYNVISKEKIVKQDKIVIIK